MEIMKEKDEELKEMRELALNGQKELEALKLKLENSIENIVGQKGEYLATLSNLTPNKEKLNSFLAVAPIVI